jgi:hypothetical protein
VPADRHGAAHLPGDAYAVIVIPTIELDMVVVQGTDYEYLKKGPGHYIDTATRGTAPGGSGSRAPHHVPAPVLQPRPGAAGDTISLITRYGRYDYR